MSYSIGEFEKKILDDVVSLEKKMLDDKTSAMFAIEIYKDLVDNFGWQDFHLEATSSFIPVLIAKHGEMTTKFNFGGDNLLMNLRIYGSQINFSVPINDNYVVTIRRILDASSSITDDNYDTMMFDNGTYSLSNSMGTSGWLGAVSKAPAGNITADNSSLVISDEWVDKIAEKVAKVVEKRSVKQFLKSTFSSFLYLFL